MIWYPVSCECSFEIFLSSGGEWENVQPRNRCEAHKDIPKVELINYILFNPDSEKKIIQAIDIELMNNPAIYQDVMTDHGPEKELKPGVFINYEFTGKGKSRGITLHIAGASISPSIKADIKNKIKDKLGDKANGRVTL